MEQNKQVQLTNDILINTAKNELNRDVTQKDQNELDILEKEFRKDKEEYANNESAGPSLMKKVVMKGERMFRSDSFRQELASLLTDTENTGHDLVSKFPDNAEDFNSIMDGSLEPTYNNNMPGYELSTGWKSQQEVIDMIKANSVDIKSKEGFKVLLDNQKALAEQANEIEGASFNWEKEYNNIMQKMVEAGDIRSLATDKIFQGRVFKDDLMESISLGSYKDLGLTDEQISKMDPTDDGKITMEDALYITSTIMKDEDQLKIYLADYYTKALEQNYYNNLNDNVRKAMLVEQGQVLNSNIKNSNEIKVGGGIIKDGIYIPDTVKK